MLGLSVKVGKRLFLLHRGVEMELLITKANNGKAGFAIKVPDDVTVLREEARDKALAAQAAPTPAA